MGIGPDGYWTPREILGYNCKYNIVLSDRGRGKSYGTKLFLMKQEGTAMCLFRQQPDMALAMESWIDPLLENGYNAEQFSWEGSDKNGWILNYNGSPKIWFRYITQVNHIKQEKFPDDMNWIWLDEFIPLVYKKLPGVSSEGDAIRTIVKTVEHDSVHSREEKGLKPLRVLMYANPFTWNNPILAYFKVKPRYGVWKVGPGVVCELIEPLEKKEGGKMTVDEFLGDEVNKNQGWMKQDAFICPKEKGSVPKYSIRLDDEYYGLYSMNNPKNLYVMRRPDHINAPRVLGTLEGLHEYEECFDGSGIETGLVRMAWKGNLWFEDMNCKFSFMNKIS